MTRSDERELATTSARHAVTELAREELLLFDVTVDAYWKNPRRALSARGVTKSSGSAWTQSRT